MSASIGAALRTGREQRRLTLAQVSEATRIRGHYLQALENDDLSAMPSAAQARGFLRIYAKFLDLDLETLIPPPAAAPAPTAATQADVATSPARPAMEPAMVPARPGLLENLRERLNRIRTRVQQADAPVQATATENESNAKKKESRQK